MTNRVALWWWHHVRQRIQNSQSDEAILSLFMSDTENSDFSGFSGEEDLSTINHQQYCILTFFPHLFALCNNCTLYLLQNVCERLSAWVSRVLPSLFISLVLVMLCFLQFDKITLHLIRHVPNRWRKSDCFKERGCTLCAVLPYRPKIMVLWNQDPACMSWWHLIHMATVNI